MTVKVPSIVRAGAAGIAILLSTALSVSANSIDESTSRALNGGADETVRVRAIAELGTAGTDASSEPLLRIARNRQENDGIRSAAVRALSELARPRAEILAAFEEIYRDPASGNNLLYTLIFSMGRLKAQESFPLLADAIESADDAIRFKAAQALGEIGTPEAFRLLKDRLRSDDDRFVRAEIVRALGAFDGPAAQDILAGVLAGDSSAVVRYNAAVLLKGKKTITSEARSALAGALTDASPMVRAAAKGVAP
ncbi:MAG: HEAT repeat domain-containing protein [Deltaproteobacteria bacterium]|nr:HEAT repeat domain-containing protein [Deltaproteobacteria bacterium]